MSWFRVDDSFHSHPKILELLERRCGMAAAGLWVLSGSLASAHDDFGSISRAALRRLGGTKAQAETLVSVGLWERDGDGYRFHDWEDYRPPPRKPEDPANVNKRVRKHRQKKRECNAALQQRETAPPVPSRPVPSVTRPNGIGERGDNSPPVSRPPTDNPPPPTGKGPALLARLTEALSHGLEDGTPPPTPPTGCRQLMVAAGPFCGDGKGPGLAADLLASGGSLTDIVTEILGELRTLADRIEAGDESKTSWRSTRVLTSNGYQRMVAENAEWLGSGGGAKALSMEERKAKAREYLENKREAEEA